MLKSKKLSSAASAPFSHSQSHMLVVQSIVTCTIHVPIISLGLSLHIQEGSGESCIAGFKLLSTCFELLMAKKVSRRLTTTIDKLTGIGNS